MGKEISREIGGMSFLSIPGKNRVHRHVTLSRSRCTRLRGIRVYLLFKGSEKKEVNNVANNVKKLHNALAGV